MFTPPRLWPPLWTLTLLLGGARAGFASQGDLLLPLPPDYLQARTSLLADGTVLLPATESGTRGGAYCGPTSSADLLKWLDGNGYPGVGAWGDSYDEVTAGIFDVGEALDCHPDEGTTTTNLRDGLQTLLDAAYPGQFDVGFIGRTSESALEQDLGRDFAWLALNLELGRLAVTNIGWYDLATGARCGGHYVAMTGYDDVAGALWARFRDPARNAEAVTTWETSRELLDLADAEGDVNPAFASKWLYERGGNDCSQNRPRTPVQDGFIFLAGLELHSRAETGPFLVHHDLASGQGGTSNAAPGSPVTSVKRHPFLYDRYHCRPEDDAIFVTNAASGAVGTLATGAPLDQPRRLAFGSDGTLYVLQGSTGAGFSLLAIAPDGALAGVASQTTMGALAYHEKSRRVLWWSGPSNQLQVFTPDLVPLGAPLALPAGPAFAAPGYLAADPTGDTLYYDHQGSSAIFRFDLQTLAALAPISDPQLADPADLALDNRGHLYVAQGSAAPVLEFDPDGVRVPGSPAEAFVAVSVLDVGRSVRTALADPDESLAHNRNVDALESGPTHAFSIDQASPTVLPLVAGVQRADDVLAVPPAEAGAEAEDDGGNGPVIALPGEALPRHALGFAPTLDLDGLSTNHGSFALAEERGYRVVFSVRRGSTGDPLTAVRRQHDLGQEAGDLFVSQLLFRPLLPDAAIALGFDNKNDLQTNQDTLLLVPSIAADEFFAFEADDLDGYDAGQIAGAGAVALAQRIYYSVTLESDPDFAMTIFTLPAGWALGDVPPLPGLAPIYADRFELGLTSADDIDALVVFDADADGLFTDGDAILLSLRAGSTSLDPGRLYHDGPGGAFAVPGREDDVFYVFRDAGLTHLARLAVHHQLGWTNTRGDIDALEVVDSAVLGGPRVRRSSALR